MEGKDLTVANTLSGRKARSESDTPLGHRARRIVHACVAEGYRQVSGGLPGLVSNMLFCFRYLWSEVSPDFELIPD